MPTQEQLERWRNAQQHEARFWAQRLQGAPPAETGTTGTSRWWTQYWAKANLGDLAGRDLLEVGGGPSPILLTAPSDAASRVVVEPLADEYRRMGYPLDDTLNWIASPIETAGLRPASFDLALSINALDHVADVPTAIKNIHAALRPGGRLFISVEVHTFIGRYAQRLYDRLHADPYHPHALTKGGLLNTMREAGFTTISAEYWSPRHNRRRSLRHRFWMTIMTPDLLVWASKAR